MPTHVIAIDGNTVNQDTGDAVIPIYKRKTIITDAQIKGLPTNPNGGIELVPAPGVGKMLVLDKAIYSKNAFGAAYTNIVDGDGIYIMPGYSGWSLSLESGFYLSSGSGVFSLQQLFGAYSGYLGANSWLSLPILSNVGGFQLPNEIKGGVSNVNSENQPLVLYGSKGENWTGGHADNIIEVTVFYSIVDLS